MGLGYGPARKIIFWQLLLYEYFNQDTNIIIAKKGLDVEGQKWIIAKYYRIF